MRIAMPSMPESLSYAVVAATGLTILVALVVAVTGPGNIAAAVLVLAIAAAIHWLIGRNAATIVTAGDAATIAVLFVVCALADLATGYPYQAVLFLIAAGALGFAFLLLQQGTTPIELRFGGVVVVASPGGQLHQRMLEELRDAGILSADEFLAKQTLVGL